MSAEINNREYRQQVLQELIGQLHDGKTVEEVQDRFAAVFGNVSAERSRPSSRAASRCPRCSGCATCTPPSSRAPLRRSTAPPTP